MLKRMMLAASVLALVAAGCGGDSAADTTGDAGTTTTTDTPAVATTVTTETTTTEVTTTTEMATTTAAPVAANGFPDTFLAIDDDYAAVEVDTQSGEVVHVFGQLADAAALAAGAEEMSPNALVGIWRVVDGSMVGLADCCEPAAGNVFYLPADGELAADPYTEGIVERGWTLSPSPTQNMFANLGYTMIVADPSVTADTGPGVGIESPELGFPTGAAAWERDGSQIYWISAKDGATGLVTLDLAAGTPVFVTELSWVGDDQLLSGVGSQASGNLVGFLYTLDASAQVSATAGVVFTVEGDLVTTFPVETDSAWGGYDATGTWLIYVDADGAVRWQGSGESGVLGDGYLFASW